MTFVSLPPKKYKMSKYELDGVTCHQFSVTDTCCLDSETDPVELIELYAMVKWCRDNFGRTARPRDSIRSPDHWWCRMDYYPSSIQEVTFDTNGNLRTGKVTTMPGRIALHLQFGDKAAEMFKLMFSEACSKAEVHI